MEKDKERYDRLLNILRKAKPELNNPREIEDAILNSLTGRGKRTFHLPDIMEFLFGWTYIGWVRRSLVTASVMLIGIFVWQQRIIITQINQLNKQVNNREITYDPSQILQDKLLFNRLSEQDLKSVKGQERTFDQLIDSMNSLQLRYRDILKLINDDPELRKMVEKKIKEQNNTRFKL